MEIKDRIIEARKRKKLTQENLANILGIKTSRISQWETGGNYPGIEILVKLCDELEITTDWLLKGENVSQVINIDYKEKYEDLLVRLSIMKDCLSGDVKAIGGALQQIAKTAFSALTESEELELKSVHARLLKSVEDEYKQSQDLGKSVAKGSRNKKV